MTTRQMTLAALVGGVVAAEIVALEAAFGHRLPGPHSATMAEDLTMCGDRRQRQRWYALAKAVGDASVPS